MLSKLKGNRIAIPTTFYYLQLQGVAIHRYMDQIAIIT